MSEAREDVVEEELVEDLVLAIRNCPLSTRLLSDVGAESRYSTNSGTPLSTNVRCVNCGKRLASRMSRWTSNSSSVTVRNRRDVERTLETLLKGTQGGRPRCMSFREEVWEREARKAD